MGNVGKTQERKEKMTEKEYKEFLEYSQKEELRLNARYYCLMGMSWEELNKADHETLLELGGIV